jgi:amidophosphoribosyltransferase
LSSARYPTAGSSAHAEAQPFYVNSPYGIVMAHVGPSKIATWRGRVERKTDAAYLASSSQNGNLTNTQELRPFLDSDAHRHINTDSDSELLLNIFANNLQKTGKFRINEEDIFTAIRDLMSQVSGAYACTTMIAGFGLIAFRDPNGIRPVGLAQRDGEKGGKDYLFASESICADALGFSDWQDVGPGEAVIVTRSGISRRQCAPQQAFAPDIFEFVYFARPDSTIDGISVYRSRMAMGDLLAEEVRKQLEAHGETIDVVIPVPETSRVAALQVAQRLQLPYREGFIKNRYVGRTFIMPGQQMRCVLGRFQPRVDWLRLTSARLLPPFPICRKKNVRRKLNAMPMEFAGKNVLLVDDSIVRGTTSKEIIQMAREVGAKKVMMASCAPPIRSVVLRSSRITLSRSPSRPDHPVACLCSYSNVYGIDMPSPHELVAHNRTEAEVATEIGADLVIFQTLPDLIKSCQQFNPSISQFECSVFTGEYVTGQVSSAYLDSIIELRNDNAKLKQEGASVGALVDGQIVREVEEAPTGCSGPMSASRSSPRSSGKASESGH